MWLTRTRIMARGALQAQQIEPYASVVKDIEKDVQAAPQQEERSVTVKQALQELYDAQSRLDKHVQSLKAEVADLGRGLQGVHEIQKGVREDLVKLDRNVRRVHQEIRDHEQHSDDEKRAACRHRRKYKSALSDSDE